MYTGTLIEELIATVEHSEVRLRQATDRAELERWYASVSQELVPVESNLVGVA